MEKLYYRLSADEFHAYIKAGDSDQSAFARHSYYLEKLECYFVEKEWLDKQIVPPVDESNISMTSFQYQGKEIQLSSRYVGKDFAIFDSERPRPHHMVTIQIDGKRHTFDFWSGLNDYRDNTKMSDMDMLSAFEMFLGDVTAADQSIAGFQQEFGYDNIKECIDVYNQCLAELNAWRQFWIDPYQLRDWLITTYDL